MKLSRSSRRDWRQSFSSGWMGMVKKPSCIGHFPILRVPET